MERIYARRETLTSELLRQEVITRDGYKQMNTALDEPLDEEMDLEPADREEEFKKMIQSTTNDVIKSDQLKEEVTEYFIGDVLQLEKLVDAFLIDDYLEGKPIFPVMDEIMKTLEGSALPKSKPQRLKLFADDIKINRYRVHSIFTRLDDAQDKEDMLFILKQLATEELVTRAI